MHTPKTNKDKILNSPSMTTSFSSPLPVQCGGRRRPGRLASAQRGCSTSEALSPRTVLIENICESVQQILQHMVPDDVVIADIAGQAIDIFLHGPESAHKNGIVNTFTHTCIPIYPCTLLKQTKSKTLNSLNMTPSFTCPLPVHRGGGRRPGVLQMLLGTAPRRRPSDRKHW